MGNMDLNSAQSSDLDSQSTYEVTPKNIQGIQDTEYTEYINTRWSRQYGWFIKNSDLQGTVLMKVTWKLGKGFTCDPHTQIITDHVDGDGKESFLSVLMNVEAQAEIGGDGYAHILRADNARNTLLNLKALDPGRMKVIYNSGGKVMKYCQLESYSSKGIINKVKNFLGMKKVVAEFEPNEIYHRRINKIGDSLGGLSKIDAIEDVLKADEQSFEDMSKIMHRQAKPMILFKIDTDNAADIAAFIAKMDEATRKGENIYVPMDKQTFEHEVIQVNVSEMTLGWRAEIRNKLFRHFGLPLSIFGNGGSSEQNGKMEYLGHEQVFAKDQQEIEKAVKDQLGLTIKLNSPVKLLQQIQQDELKDGAQQQTSAQPQDLTPGAGF